MNYVRTPRGPWIIARTWNGRAKTQACLRLVVGRTSRNLYWKWNSGEFGWFLQTPSMVVQTHSHVLTLYWLMDACVHHQDTNEMGIMHVIIQHPLGKHKSREN